MVASGWRALSVAYFHRFGMHLHILGCGTSTGVPVIGCGCGVCTSPDPRNKRSRTSAYLRLDNGSTLLIDASMDLRFQALRDNLRRIDAVLFTHAHADHIFGIDDLRGFNFAQRQTIPCYATAATLAEIRYYFRYVFDVKPHSGGALPQITLHEIDETRPFELCGITVQPFRVMHGALAVTGYRFGDLAYATDCNAIPSETKAALGGVKHLVLDALRHERHSTHFTISDAVAVAQELAIPNTYLIHMGHTIDYQRESEKLPSGIRFCYDGMEIRF